jgi:hypothetical protein
MFSKEVCACFDRESQFFGRLTKLRQTRSVTDFIMTFEQLDIHTKGLSDEFYLECFINGLKEAIKAHVNMHHPTTWLQACQLARKEETILQMPSLKAPFTTQPCLRTTPALTQTLKVQNLSPIEMEEHHKQGLCYYCDEKYAPGHKCREQKFFQIDASASFFYENIPSDEVSNQEMAQPSDPVEDSVVTSMESMDPIISLHALAPHRH